MFKPFSDNIVFYDTEFSSRNPYEGELLSIGAVKMNGEEFYCEIEYDGEYSEWVKENLLESLTQEKISKEKAKEKLAAFLGSDKPYLVCYNRDYDIAYTYKLYQGIDAPFHHGSVDFFSVLFGLGIDPNSFSAADYSQLPQELGIEVAETHTHNALDDAKFLREVYLALMNK